MSEQTDSSQSDRIAIIGLSGRFPGASSPAALWLLLKSGVDAITFFTDEQLLSAGESPDRLQDPAYVKACGRLDDIAGFDAPFFGMSPRDAAVFDPQHRLFLECAWEAFEDAGYVGEQVEGAVAVFAAAGGPEYYMHNLLRNRQIMESVGAWLVRHNGNDQNFLATRTSYELNLRGPSVNVQTACSSALTAVHLACQSLLNGECDMALAGGSTVYPEQNLGYIYRQGEILSPDGHCRTFDARASGTVMSSAVGCVLLKRLDDALRDGDRVLAHIRGSAYNNDGSDKVGYLAPSVSGQTRVISEALDIAGVQPDEVSYVEAHGTGTLIGDPIELTALTQAFRARTGRTQFCALGSIKSNIGHAGEAAGICGLIKTVLALQHRELPPSLHYEQPNPQIDFASSPFIVNAMLRPWTVPPGRRRVAGVTALGAGGTNVHVIVEEAPEPAASGPSRTHQILTLSARTQAALEHATARLAAHLRAHPQLPLADVAYTLLTGRKTFPHRRVVVARDLADAAAALEDRARANSHHHALANAPSVYFGFPGGGAQYVRMGADLYEREPVYRDAFDRVLSYVEPAVRGDVHGLVLGLMDADATNSLLEMPSRALPALFACEYAISQTLLAWGVSPAAMIGHSAGEYAAACLAGVMTARDAMALVALRGRLFEGLAPGRMLSVQLPPAEARQYMSPTLSFAAINGPRQCVLSGPVAEIACAEEALRAAAVDCVRVHIHVAAHSAMVEPILGEFERFCRTIPLRPPAIPFVSNVTGTWITDAEATDPAYWVRHLRSTVRFADGARTLFDSAPGAFLEIGPGRTLTSLVRQQTVKPLNAAPTMRHPEESGSDVAMLLGAVGRLWATGVPLDASRLFADEDRRRVALPTYPFERQRYWIAPDLEDPRALARRALRKQPDIADWFAVPAWVRSAAPAAASEPCTWLVLHDSSPTARALRDRLRRAGHRLVEVTPAETFAQLGADRYAVNPGNRSDFAELANRLRAGDLLPRRVLHLLALREKPARWDYRRWGHRIGGSRSPLAAYGHILARNFFSLVHLAHVFAPEATPLSIYCVSSNLQAATPIDEVHPETAVLLGPCKVIPREYPGVDCISIDVDAGASSNEILLAQLMREVQSDPVEGEVALRGRDRWVRRFEPSPLPPVLPRSWMRSGGTYLITGGLGGIALRVAEHLAAGGHVRLALISRTPLPPPEAQADWIAGHGPEDETSLRLATVDRIRKAGADVLVVAADVADVDAMRRALGEVRSRFGPIHGVFHAAGVIKDELIALRDPEPESPILDAKMKGALVLDALLRDEPLDLFVLFSSVSAILGLPGQVDYTAANAYLDAFAAARSTRARGRTLSIDWNGWQEVGFLARQVSQPRAIHSPGAPAGAAGDRHPALSTITTDTPDRTLVTAGLSRRECWVVGEHIVRGGDAVMPGTGFLEFVRAAFELHAEARPVEFRDVVFLGPFIVPAGGRRDLHIRIERSAAHAFTCYAESADEPLVIGHVRPVDEPPARRVDLDAIRARCLTPGPYAGGRLVQGFMDFGPRWANVSRIDLGTGEALVTLELPQAFHGDLDLFRLHPALLDMATGAAQAVLPGFKPETTFNVPFSYGRLLLRRRLASRIVSHVRLLPEDVPAQVAFDVRIYDELGEELVAIDRFVMRKTAGAFGKAMPAMAIEAPRRRDAAASESVAAALRAAMAPAEGLDALDRLLATEFAPQVVVCTIPLKAWLERLAAESHGQGVRGNGLDVDRGPLVARSDSGVAFVPPRDDVERELAAQWGSLLGISAIGLDDDFFELGGQSLVAVRLFQWLNRKYGVDLPLATLFQAPTLKQCAARLRERLGLPEPSASAGAAETRVATTAISTLPTKPSLRLVVPIQHGEDDRPPLFIVHGAGGNVLNFRDLARAMELGQPVYGIQAAGIDGVTPLHETIEAMADAYLAEVRTVQPAGPYFFAGYSGGGLVAFEMARRLTADGKEAVGLLAFIDTFHPQMPLVDMTMRVRIGRLQQEGLSYLRGVAARQIQSVQQRRDAETLQAHIARGESVPVGLREMRLTRGFEYAVDQYHAKTWNGTATLFKAEQVSFHRQAGGPAYAWDKYVLGGVDIVNVPGEHATVVLGLGGRIVAGRIQQLILEATARAVAAE